jgi:hypothetical protein
LGEVFGDRHDDPLPARRFSAATVTAADGSVEIRLDRSAGIFIVDKRIPAAWPMIRAIDRSCKRPVPSSVFWLNGRLL